jgi:IS1 family transposase
MLGMNKLNTAERVRVISSLVEGNSIASTVRMTGIAKTTILRLIAQLGDACVNFHNKKVRNLRTKRIQADEVWAFCYAKSKNVPADKKGHFGFGDTWTWTAIDADSKVMISWIIGGRDAGCANEIMEDVAWRLDRKVQVTTDALQAYNSAIGNHLGDSDYAQLVKVYGTEKIAPGRYSPPVCVGVEVRPQWGNPDPKHISTSFVERLNLTVRMGIRRYTRLTNGYSKKIENHMSMTSIFFTYYNFCRVHQTLRVTPAMEAGLTDHVWELDELLENLLGKSK